MNNTEGSISHIKMALAIDDTFLHSPTRIVDLDHFCRDQAKSMMGLLHKLGGVGLAANQVGLDISIFVTDVRGDKPRVFVNPIITSYDGPENMEIDTEGCLSFPGQWKSVPRYRGIDITAFTEKGKAFSLHAVGLLARVIQHEYDHLSGKTIF